MNLLLYGAQELRDGLLEVGDRRLAHLRDVLGAKPGDRIRVGEIGGRIGQGEILELHPNHALIACSREESPPPKLPLILVLALPRPKMLRRILRAVAEFGIPELHLINGYRVEKSFWQSPVLEPAATRSYLLQGLEQCRDTILPEVTLHRRFKPFVEDLLPVLLERRRGLVAHPGDYPACPRQLGAPALLAVGPEGGFIPYEVDKLRDAGCQVVSLGPRILRVEHAVTGLLGRLA